MDTVDACMWNVICLSVENAEWSNQPAMLTMTRHGALLSLYMCGCALMDNHFQSRLPVCVWACVCVCVRLQHQTNWMYHKPYQTKYN